MYFLCVPPRKCISLRKIQRKMIDTMKYDPNHNYEEDAFEIFDPIIDEVNDILDAKEVPASCNYTDSYLYYLAMQYDRLDPPVFRRIPEVDEACQLLKEHFNNLSEEENQIVEWHARQSLGENYSNDSHFYCLYDRWLSSLIQFKADFEQEGQILSALAQQGTRRSKKLMS